MSTEKSEDDSSIKEDTKILRDLPSLTDGQSWGHQKVDKGWLVWVTGPNGVITALTFVPD